MELLRCPSCGGRLTVRDAGRRGSEIVSGELACVGCSATFPVVDGIPRFVPKENYASSFGFEWHRFAELQNDRLQGHTITHERFFLQLDCKPGDLAGLRVLEVGCGGGRFSDLVLDAGAELVAIDLSTAVEKNREIHVGNTRFNGIQASALAIPLAHASFDLVFCFGVLQHTPDPARSFESLVPFVRRGGRLAVDVYAAHPKQSLHWKYLIRPITKRMNEQRLLQLIEQVAPVLVPISRQIRRIPVFGKALSRLVPIFVHDGFLGRVSREEEVRWAVLETFDALSPAYDRPRSLRTVRRWFQKAGFTNIVAANLSNALNYGRGTRPT